MIEHAPRRNQLEVDAILNAGIRAFVITAGGMRAEEQIELLLRAMPKSVSRGTKRLARDWYLC